MSKSKLIALAAGLIAFIPAEVWSESCGFLRQDPLTLLDRQVYYEDVPDSWKLLTAPIQADRARSIKLAYVFREQSGDSRSGVVVIKSARNRGLTEQRRVNSVALVRETVSTCRGSQPFSATSVSSKAYDNFHDSGLSSTDAQVLRDFHSSYLGRRKRCKLTNDNASDSLIPFDPRSNRGQFSFDPKVVSGGTYSQVLAWAGVTTAYASSENLEDQRVEIQHYKTDAKTPSCVRFTLPPQRAASFLRINDLEGVTDTPPFIRAAEQEWGLTP